MCDFIQSVSGIFVQSRGETNQQCQIKLYLFVSALPFSPSTPVPSEIATYSLRLTWYAPEYDGGTPLTNYELQLKNQTMTSFQFLMFTKLTSVVISGLQAGKKYAFRVAARNALGRGRWSGDTGLIPMKILGTISIAFSVMLFLFILVEFRYLRSWPKYQT